MRLRLAAMGDCLHKLQLGQCTCGGTVLPPTGGLARAERTGYAAISHTCHRTCLYPVKRTLRLGDGSGGKVDQDEKC